MMPSCVSEWAGIRDVPGDRTSAWLPPPANVTSGTFAVASSPLARPGAVSEEAILPAKSDGLLGGYPSQADGVVGPDLPQRERHGGFGVDETAEAPGRSARAEDVIPLHHRMAAVIGLAALAVGTVSCNGGTTTTYNGPADEVRAATVGSLGEILVDGQGYTLYILVPDNRSGHSTCFDTCAAEWPPMTLSSGTAAPVAGPGIKPALLGLTDRGGGLEQVTYNGWPLYRWPNDSSPGMATGQGVNDQNGLWYVLSPAGTVVR